MKPRSAVMLLAGVALVVLVFSACFIYLAMDRMAAGEVEKAGGSHLENLQHRLETRFSIYTGSVKTLAQLFQIRAALDRRDATAVAAANHALDIFTRSLGADVCYLMNEAGQTLASSNRETPVSFVGQNHRFQPYFSEALSGKSAIYMAIGVTTGQPGIYFSHPVQSDAHGRPAGVVVMKVRSAMFRKEFRESHHRHDGFLALKSPEGFVFLSDSARLEHRLLWHTDTDNVPDLEKSRQFGQGPFLWSGLRLFDDKKALDAEGNRFLIHEVAVSCCPGWRLVHLTDEKAIQEIMITPMRKTMGSLFLALLAIFGAAVLFLSGKVRRDLMIEGRMRAHLIRQNVYMVALHDVSLAMINQLEIGELLDSVLNSACSLFGTRHAFLFLPEPDGSALRLRNAVGGIFNVDDVVRLRAGEGVSGRVWATGSPMRVDGYGRWEDRLPYPAHERIHTVVAVPVRCQQTAVEGVLGLGFESETNTIPEASDEILERFSELIAIALTNARLFGSARKALDERRRAEQELRRSFDEVQVRTAEVTALLNASRAVLNAGPFEQTARSILSQCKDALGVAACGLSLLSDAEPSETIVQLDTGGMDATADLSHPLPISEMKAEAYRSVEPVIHDCIPVDRVREMLPVDAGSPCSVLLAPLVEERRSIGLLTLVNKPGGFSESDARLAAAFADQAATALGKNRAMDALVRSEARFRSVIEKNTDAIMVVDKNGIVRFANPMAETFFCRTSQGLVGTTFGLPMTGGESTEIEILPPTGQTVIAEMRLVETEWEGETVYFASLRDITERKEAERERNKLEEQLRQAQKMEAIGTLAGGIAHDFNNILSAVIGFSELALEMAEPDTLLRDNLDEVLKAGRRARDLINQILTFSRQGEQEVQPLVIQYLAKELMKMLRATLPATIEIHQQLDSESTVMADPTQMHQILMNLCTNAGYVMRETGGILTVSLTDVQLDAEDLSEDPAVYPGTYLRLSVTDTGPGIDSSIRDRIFDPFFTTKEKGEGTGMGLSVVHGIVNHHGGFITVESTPGQGAAFHVFLPVIDVEAAAETDAPAEMPHGCERILVVDDEAPICKLAQRTLDKLGYTVSTLMDSVEALDRIVTDADAYDLLITDLTMPKMTGLQLAAAAKGVRPDLPVILATGFSGDLAETELASVGIDALIRKPLLKGELAETVRNVLDKDPANEKTIQHMTG